MNSEFGIRNSEVQNSSNCRAVGAFSLLLVVVLGAASVRAQEAADEADAFKAVEYTAKGLDIRSRDGNFLAHINWRAQLRLTERNFDDPIAPSPEVQQGEFAINRARFKMGGHAYRTWLKYYLEYDLVNTWLLDLRFTLKASDALQLRVGQWKVPYNRERVDSSGKQQFAERSVVTRWFTVDRQQGAALFGRIAEGTHGDSWYNLCLNTATGRGGSGDVDQAMSLGRWQWNFLGRDLPFSQSDISRRPQPAGSLAVAAASWRGPYVGFSSKGGGALPGYPVGGPGAYRVEQAMIETAFQWRGISWQQEYHWKTIEDTVNETVTDLVGWYAQAGYLFNGLFEWFPRPLEIALRAAQVDRNTALEGDLEEEATLVFNWFFSGHSNKLTFDITRLHDENEEIGRRWETRFRIQWDVQF